MSNRKIFDLSKPFSSFAVIKITIIRYITFLIGILSVIARQTAKNLSQYGYEIDALNQFWVDSQAFILMAVVICVIGKIFNKGVEIQNENDLTM